MAARALIGCLGPAQHLATGWANPTHGDLFDQIGSADKVFVNVTCASHFLVWEKQHRALHEASLEWLRDVGLQQARAPDRPLGRRP